MSKIFDVTDTETIAELAKIVSENDLGEITVAADGKSLTIKGKKAAAAVQAYAPSMPPVSPAAQNIGAAAESAAPEPISGTAVKAPIVGTFYSKPRPDASPFVTVGSKVKTGDVLYILETMKVMNEISAECDGVISKILVNDGDPLEYGQTVMIIS